MEEDANLNPYGRMMAAGVIKAQLVNRLLLQRARAQGQTRADLLAPIIVTGLPRTGTTFLHRLLAADPAHASLPYWQVRRPIPLNPQDTPEARLTEATAFLEVRRALTPELDGIHLIRPESPEECFWMTAQSMVSRLYWNLAPVHGYQRWVSRADKTAKYADYADQLRYLQGVYPGQRLVLKAPDHNDGIAELLAALPEAKVIITHRDMIEQMGSYFSLGRTTRILAVNAPDPAREAETIVDMTDVSLAKMDAVRSTHPDRILDVRYTDMMADPLATVERIYGFCGLSLAETRRAAIAQHHANNPKGKHGEHAYSLAEFGLDDEWVRARYAAYSATFVN
ncbi:sulfotransferase family protein [Ruegeria marina]|uniref:Sulfotransferase family protein n=1 Tax=Ruegeria marina TaxID=639004 RepID=A0A1G6JYL4_9RHOB|nr:sulfotransferase [Ruegeria marina]SDC23804.1 Sulfotransferase family protein [Ruegeria marina]